MPVITSANTTIEYFDGWDEYSTVQLSRYWTTVNSTIAVSAGNGRNGTNSLRITNDNHNVTIRLTSQTTRTIGFAFRTAATTNLPKAIANLTDSGTAQLSIRLNADLTFSILCGATVLSTSSFTISLNIFYYIEFTSVIDPSAGSYNLKINSVSWTSGSGAVTRASSNSSSNTVFLGNLTGGGNSVGAFDYDDFYSRSDGTFCGDCRVETKLPTGDGNSVQYTKSTGASNFGNVDENPANDDTDYNASSAANDIDQYTYPALSTTSGTIFAIMTAPILKVDTAGVATTASLYRVASTNYVGGTQNISATTYNLYPDIQGKDVSNTTNDWTVSGVNATQFGVKRLS